MTPRVLAQAFVLLAQRTPQSEYDALIARLSAYATSRGRGDMVPAVLREALEFAKKEGSKRAGALTVAHNEDITRLLDKAIARLRELGAQGEPTVRTDPTLVTGFVVSCGAQRYDASGKRGLISLYRHLLEHTS